MQVNAPTKTFSATISRTEPNHINASKHLNGNSSTVYVDAAVQVVEPVEAGVQCDDLESVSLELEQHVSDGELANFLKRTVRICEEALRQNELADVLYDDFAGMADDDALDSITSYADKVTEYQSFTDLEYSRGKSLAALQWHPTNKELVAAACSAPSNLTERAKCATQGGASTILIWNLRDPINPEAVLQAPADVFAFKFNPKQPQFVVAGCLAGQIAMWNLDNLQLQRAEAARVQPNFAGSGQSAEEQSKAETVATILIKANVLEPSYVSLLDTCHQATVTDLVWLPGLAATRDGRLEQTSSENACNLFATVAMDGKILVWDMTFHTKRRGRPTMSEDDAPEWTPLLSIPIQNSMNQPFSGTCLVCDPKPSMTTRFIVGSLEGDIALVDSNIRQAESSRAHNAVAHASSSCGRVRTLTYSPFFHDLLLAISDSGFTIWKNNEGDAFKQHPIFESKFSDAFYTTGCWSSTKPGVILVGRLDGKLEIWDLLDRSHAPVLIAPICPAAILALGISASPSDDHPRPSTHSLLAVADAAGILHIVDIPRTLRRRARDEVKSMAALMEREESRVAYVLERQAVREKLRKDMEPKRRSSVQFAQSSVSTSGKARDEDDIDPQQQAEMAYRKLEEEWRDKMGLLTLEQMESSRGTASAVHRADNVAPAAL